MTDYREYTPTREKMRDLYAMEMFLTEHDGHVHDQVSDGDPEFNRFIAEVERLAAEKAWAAGWEAGNWYAVDDWFDKSNAKQSNPHILPPQTGDTK